MGFIPEVKCKIINQLMCLLYVMHTLVSFLVRVGLWGSFVGLGPVGFPRREEVLLALSL